MLTRQIKREILSQETYRHKTKTELEKRSSTKSKLDAISSVLNSAFFLWFLSSVVLAAISFFYARWDKQKTFEQYQLHKAAEIARENRMQARKLDAEISNRLRYFAISIHLKAANDTLGFTIYPLDADAIQEAVITLENPMTSQYRVGLFTEFNNRNLRSLLFELKDIVPDEEKEEIEWAYKKSIFLQDLYLHRVRLNSGLHSKNMTPDSDTESALRWDKSWT